MLGPDVVVAGPAFDAGRYGLACGRICQATVEELGVPGVTGLFPENPAVDLYRRHRDEIAAALLDVRMPGMNGPETLEALREIDPHLRCSFMTGDPGSTRTREWLERQLRIFRTMWSFSWCLTERYERLSTRRTFQVVGDGMEHWQALLASGRGFIVVTAHIGNWEWGAALLSRLGD